MRTIFWLFFFCFDLLGKKKKKLDWQKKKGQQGWSHFSLLFCSLPWSKKIRNKAFPFKYLFIYLLPGLFVLVNVACKITMSRQYQMEMMERRAREWPAGPIHACSLSGTHRRLHTHPTPSSCQARKKGLPPIFTQWQQKSYKSFEDKKRLQEGILENAEYAGRGKGRWINKLAGCLSLCWWLKAKKMISAFTHVQTEI